MLPVLSHTIYLGSLKHIRISFIEHFVEQRDIRGETNHDRKNMGPEETTRRSERSSSRLRFGGVTGKSVSVKEKRS